MSKRAFRLASLLRLRRAQEDQASVELARAAADRLRASERADRQRHELSGHRTPAACSPAGWTASIAARAALSAATRQAAVDVEQATVRVDSASAAWRARRGETKALEHLEQRHREQVTEQLLRQEQLRIDEHTSATRHRQDVSRRATAAPRPGTRPAQAASRQARPAATPGAATPSATTRGTAAPSVTRPAGPAEAGTEGPEDRP